MMRQQAEKFGTRYVYDSVVSVDFTQGSPFIVKTYEETYEAEAVIVTAGASPKKLGIPGEDGFVGRGVSYCATCDGFFFRGKDVVVVGGGDSAIEEGLFLTKFATSVNIIHRREELRAGALLQKRAAANEKIGFVWNTVIDEIRGNGTVQAIALRNTQTGVVEEKPIDGVFIFIGHYPNSDFLRGHLEMDEHGYVITDELMRTSVPGVFAAGEIQDSVYRQVATSVGQGCAAALQAQKWLSDRE